MAIALEVLLRDSHQHTYGEFKAKYEDHARALNLTYQPGAEPPSSSQYYRWLEGKLRRLPHGPRCIVLENMFPGWTVAQLFSPEGDVADQLIKRSRNGYQDNQFADAVTSALQTRDIRITGWGQPHRTAATSVSSKSLGDFDDTDLPEHMRKIRAKVLALSKVLRLDNIEIVQIAGLAGNVVELDHQIDINVDAHGFVRITYTHEIFNMSDDPVTRIARQLFFEYTAPDGLRIDALDRDRRSVAIERTHDAGTLAKFSCLISPAIEPGETGTVSYTCTGGRFIDKFYWRQDFNRFARLLTIRLRQAGDYRLTSCSGELAKPSGTEPVTTHDLLWDEGDGSFEITLVRDHLRPNDAVTLRWEMDRGYDLDRDNAGT